MTITQDMIDTWRTNYGLDTKSPEDAMRYWHDRCAGMAPAGAVAALGLALNALDALTSGHRLELQAQGKHPAPCARFCEATAFNIELRRLRGDLADLSTKTRALCLRAPGWWEETIAADEAARRAA